MAKKQTFVGIEQDNGSLVAVRLGVETRPGSKKPEFRLLDVYEIQGEFANENTLFEALKNLKGKMGVSSSEQVVTCLYGKQTFAGQLNVKKLPDSEMNSMLKLELRKTMPFEPMASVFDYQWLPVPENHPKNEGFPIFVAAASNSLLTKHLRIYEKAGIKPDVIEVLPAAIADAFWAERGDNVQSSEPHVMLHTGSDTCTLVIDGINTPFFCRSFAFDSKSVETGSAEASVQVTILSDELNKSLTYYRNTFRGGDVSSITLMGACASQAVFDILSRKTGMNVEYAQTAQLISKTKPPAAGKFDLAAALAMKAV